MSNSRYETDILIIGCGLAGLYTALHIDPRLRVLFVTKEGADTSNSWLAQGGIAAAVGAGDDPALHFADTLEAGAGLCDEAAVRVLVEEGPREIETLRGLTVPFDLTPDGKLSVTREGGHRRNRVVHAGGDATGRETVKTLAPIAQIRTNIEFWERGFFGDLITDGLQVTGAHILAADGVMRTVSARCVILCAGGSGRIYGRTTNPAVATGDGIAAAYRAGAKLKNMEFVQFHPTGLYEGESSAGRAFLITEALRGEGALLRNAGGERFMAGQHPLEELAPRDIVARAIAREMQAGSPCVYLDIRERGRAFLEKRFPTVYAECARRGIALERDMIPVSPVQHYMVGGIATGLYAETTLKGLYAVGENACTGVHGANRLASNSMLECLVFGRRCAEHIHQSAPERAVLRETQPPPHAAAEADVKLERLRRDIRAVCDRDAYILRTPSGMARGAEALRWIVEEARQIPVCRESRETLNMAQTALCVLESAAKRGESVGTHFVE